VLDPPEEPQLLFRRDPPVPDFQLQPDEVDAATVAGVHVLWVAAGALSHEPSASTVEGMLKARGRRRHTVLDLVRLELEVRDRRVAAEQQLGLLGRVEHREHRRRDRVRLHPDEPGVDSELAQLLHGYLAERIVTDLGVERGAVPEAGGRDRHVGGAAADRLAEALRRMPISAELIAVQIDADPTDREQLQIRRRSINPN